MKALKAYPGGLQVGGGINPENAGEFLDAGASHVIVTSYVFADGIINKDNIAKMKDGVIIINNSRGQMVVEQDLADALNSGKVACAALDVVSTEPIRGDNPLLKAKNCIITPHISWAPIECRRRILDGTVENIRAFLSGKPLPTVNM